MVTEFVANGLCGRAALDYYAALTVLEAASYRVPEYGLCTNNEGFYTLIKNPQYQGQPVFLSSIYNIKDLDNVFEQMDEIKRDTKGAHLTWCEDFAYNAIGCFVLGAKMPRFESMCYIVNKQFNLCNYGFYDIREPFNPNTNYLTHYIDLEGFCTKLIKKYPDMVVVIISLYERFKEKTSNIKSRLYDEIMPLDEKAYNYYIKVLDENLSRFYDYVENILPQHARNLRCG